MIFIWSIFNRLLIVNFIKLKKCFIISTAFQWYLI